MKIVRAESLGSFADYTVIEADQPRLGTGQVMIKVAACGMGYVDALVAVGGYQVKPPMPYTPGQEIGGTVLEVASDVAGLKPGDRVVATSFGGGLAEYAAVPAQAVMKLPANMSFAQACVFPINYLTAAHALLDRARLEAGERLLIIGAAGGVGSAAIQVGKILGAKIVACASTAEKQDYAKKLGADTVIGTSPDGWRDALKAACDGHSPDLVFDPVCGPLFEPAFRSLRWGGRHVVIGFTGGPIPSLPANLTIMKGAALVGADVRQLQIFEPQKAQRHLKQLLGWVAEGQLAISEGQRFALGEFAQAMEHALSGRALGKSVIVIDESQD